ncbi:hypothetical protein [Nocardioides sp.]|nr:hypothetical protein [Nocardioides sp.]MDI6910291.1 hypothetical protein [Nocardioides sp.]
MPAPLSVISASGLGFAWPDGTPSHDRAFLDDIGVDRVVDLS